MKLTPVSGLSASESDYLICLFRCSFEGWKKQIGEVGHGGDGANQAGVSPPSKIDYDHSQRRHPLPEPPILGGPRSCQGHRKFSDLALRDRRFLVRRRLTQPQSSEVTPKAPQGADSSRSSGAVARACRRRASKSLSIRQETNRGRSMAKGSNHRPAICFLEEAVQQLRDACNW